MTRTRTPRCIGRAQWTPETGKPLAKFVVPERKIDEPSRRITFTISTAARDRDGDTIDQAGWDLDEYRKNPVVLWAHEGWSPPIARAESVMVESGKLVSIARFAKREEYDFADTIFQLYKGGFLNATSVGFEPSEMELMDGLEPGEIGFRFRRQKLLEYSAVPIPSNPEALVVARGAGIDVAPCEAWVEKALDERAAGPLSDLLNRTYIALKGRLHPVMQDDIAKRNVARIESKADDDGNDRPKIVTGPGGEDDHTHEFRQGDPQTGPGGDDGHVHALTYDDDGNAVLEGNFGHTHPIGENADAKNGDVGSEEEVAVQTPSNDPLSPIEGQPEGQRGANGGAAKPVVAVFGVPDSEEFRRSQSQMMGAKKITDWPQPGMSLPVSLLTSEYRPFPLAEAKALREDWPEIWALGFGDDDPGVSEMQDDGPDETAVLLREEWAAKHVDDFDLPGVVRQVQMRVRGSRGIEHMRRVLSLAKEVVINKRDEAKGLSPEETDAVIDRVVSEAVIPALSRTLDRLRGRVS